MKRLYRKFLIWHHGKFKDRIVRCNFCKFRIFNNDPESYKKMIHHNLFDCKKLSPLEQINYLEKELEKQRDQLIKSILEHEF